MIKYLRTQFFTLLTHNITASPNFVGGMYFSDQVNKECLRCLNSYYETWKISNPKKYSTDLKEEMKSYNDKHSILNPKILKQLISYFEGDNLNFVFK